MNKIFIEAKKEATSECQFLKTVLSKHFPEMPVQFVCMDGVGNLFNETNLNQMKQAKEEGDTVIVILDADTPAKGGGFAARSTYICEKMDEQDLLFPFFLYPNHTDDGDVETLMESLARKDLHRTWWDCFDDYEKCVGGMVDDKGSPLYNLPNRKAKLHTFISSQRLSNKKRSMLGNGCWLFDDVNYWNLSSPELDALLKFLGDNLKIH